MNATVTWDMDGIVNVTLQPENETEESTLMHMFIKSSDDEEADIKTFKASAYQEKGKVIRAVATTEGRVLDYNQQSPVLEIRLFNKE